MIDALRPIVHLPRRSSNALVPIQIVPLLPSHIVYWCDQVQPLIDRLYCRWAPGNFNQRVRADAGWNWQRILSLIAAHNTLQSIRASPEAMASTRAILIHGNPAGLLVYVRRFRCYVHGARSVQTFIWFVSAAPPEYYWHNHFAAPRGVTLSLIDTAIQHGVIGCGSDGLLLHADPHVDRP